MLEVPRLTSEDMDVTGAIFPTPSGAQQPQRTSCVPCPTLIVDCDESDDDEINCVSITTPSPCSCPTLQSMQRSHRTITPTVHPPIRSGLQWMAALGEDVPRDVMACASSLYQQYIERRSTHAMTQAWLAAYSPRTPEECMTPPFADPSLYVALCKWLESWRLDASARVDMASGVASLFHNLNGDDMRSSPRLRKLEEEQRFRLQSRPGYWLPKNEVSNALIFRAAPGSGLTACIYAAAQELNMRIVEVNTAMLRTPKALTCILNDVAQSHMLRRIDTQQQIKSVWDDIPELPPIEKPKQIPIPPPPAPTAKKDAPPPSAPGGGRPKKMAVPQKLTQEKVNAFFAPRKKAEPKPLLDAPSVPTVEEAPKISTPKKSKTPEKRPREEVEIEEIVDDTPPPFTVVAPLPTPRSIPLILFENCDIAFDDEPGFYTLIQNVCDCAKCPVIMTCSIESEIVPNVECPLIDGLTLKEFDLPKRPYTPRPDAPGKFFFTERIHLLMITASHGVMLSEEDLMLLPQFRLKSLLSTLQFYTQHSTRAPWMEGENTEVERVSLLRNRCGLRATDSFLKDPYAPNAETCDITEEHSEVDTLFRSGLSNPAAAAFFSLVDRCRRYADSGLPLRELNHLARLGAAQKTNIHFYPWDKEAMDEELPRGDSLYEFAFECLQKKTKASHKRMVKAAWKSHVLFRNNSKAVMYSQEYLMAIV